MTLTIRTAGSMIAVVFRQAIDVTAREGDQDWSWLRYSYAFRFSSTLAQAPFGSVGQPPSHT
jgi:hypothetical protein